MIKKPLFLEMFLLIFIVGVLNYLALKFDLYWSLYEFDSLVHFLGGAMTAAFFVWIYFFSGFFVPKRRFFFDFLIISIVGSMAVAFFWEAYELILGEAIFQKKEYYSDTITDLVMDFLGILLVSFYAYFKELKIKNNQ